MLPDEADFSQEYWMSFKKNRGSMAEKGLLFGRVDNFQTGPTSYVSYSVDDRNVRCTGDDRCDGLDHVRPLDLLGCQLEV